MNQKSGSIKSKSKIWTHTCPVCTAGANGHLHYGSVCCYACRGFFRRTTRYSRLRGKLKCANIGQCEINSEISRLHCPPCRYEKCLSVGMRPEFVTSRVVMSEQDKKEARARYAKQRQEDRCQRQQHDQKDVTLTGGEYLANSFSEFFGIFWNFLEFSDFARPIDRNVFRSCFFKIFR